MLGNPLTDPAWATKLVDTIERWVGTARHTVTDRAVKASRAIVFGVVVVCGLLTATPLAVIVFTRFVQVVLSRILRTDHGSTVWASYLVSGAVFMFIGFVLLRKRHKKEEAA